MGLNELPEADASAVLGASVKQYRYHQVKRGDTLSKIASENGIDLNTILELNDLSAKTPILPGQLIYLPADKPK